MLSIGPGSICDVCLEPFGRASKAPCSIPCGHVFCIECVNHLRVSNANPNRPDIDVGAPCPLCRTHFDKRSMIKLHVDLDNIRGPQTLSPVRASCPTAAEAEARRLQEAIASVANAGTTEPRLRQLIGEATSFLSTQPRDQFTDLRVSHRMIAYLCDIKSKLRDLKGDHEKEVKKLQEEKGELERQAEYMAIVRKDEKETALAVEMSLRHHCTRAHKAYEDMVGHYNFVVGEWTKLSEQLARLRSSEIRPPEHDVPVQTTDVTFASEVTSSLSTYFSSYHDHQMKISEAAVADPTSFLVSPLPEFTSAGLPSSAMNAFPLPDIENDFEKKPKARQYGQSSLGCSATGHPVSCPCIEVPRFPEMPHLIQSKVQAGSSLGQSTSLAECPATFESSTNATPTATIIPFNMSLRDHDHNEQVRRSTSRSSRHSSRSRPSSQTPTRSSSPPCRPASVKTHSRIPTPLDESMPSSSAARMNMSVSQSQGWNNNRLQGLLQDSTSSSLPNMPSHFPAALSRESYQSREKDRSRSPSRSRKSSLHKDPESPPADSTTFADRAPIRTNPSSTYDPLNVPVSTASVAASAIEKAKRERQQQELERDRQRTDKREGMEQDNRRRADPERTRSHQESGVSSHSAPISQRESIGPIYISTSAYASQRTSSRSSRSGPSALRDSFNAEKNTAKALPVVGMTRV